MSNLLNLDKGQDHFQNAFCKMEIKEGVLYSVFTPFLEITIEVAKTIVADRIKFSKGIAYPMLLDISNLKYISREAREYFASEAGIKNLLAGAYFATTQNEKFLWYMFLKINRPAIPRMMFTDKKEALKWLEQFK